jgi:PAS domain S-box-containing protein
VLANAAFADAVARTRDELIGQPISQFTWKSQSQEELPWNRAQQHGETITSSLIHSAEPLSRIYEVSAVPIQDESGTVRGSMVSFEDVTEREMQKADLLKRMDDVRSFHDSNPAEPAEDVSLPGHRSTIVSVSAAETVMHDLNELGTCLSEQDFDRIAAITEHMKQSATELGAERLKTTAHNLQTAVLSDSDMLDILQMARELTEECRDLQVQ